MEICEAGSSSWRSAARPLFNENSYINCVCRSLIKHLQQMSVFKPAFHAVQFSTIVRTVFTFNDYIDDTAISKLEKERPIRGLTNTYRALDFVLKEHLNNTSNGATEEATKVLVLITDGDPSDTDRRYGAIEKYDSMNIIRFVIGVGRVDVTRLRIIASEPKDENTFYIENYDGLTGVLENLQNKIV
ncbi:hypothetical protein WMY93_007149 [Mugilogobius chulae]|uniref:VWFA domain-containing protein n=1 Tax=Mugilogobius chulae TaxID=88201 RepID=A0AAW0PWF5_9GOBI